MEKWIYYTLISTIFFVIGQVCLKFDDNDAILISCYFNISMGLLGLLTLLYLNNYNLKKKSIAYYGIIAGIFFFLESDAPHTKTIKTGSNSFFTKST